MTIIWCAVGFLVGLFVGASIKRPIKLTDLTISGGDVCQSATIDGDVRYWRITHTVSES